MLIFLMLFGLLFPYHVSLPETGSAAQTREEASVSAEQPSSSLSSLFACTVPEFRHFGDGYTFSRFMKSRRLQGSWGLFCVCIFSFYPAGRVLFLLISSCCFPISRSLEELCIRQEKDGKK